MCQIPLPDFLFFRFLLQVDETYAAEVQAAGCPCGGVLHRADYPRKPRGCPQAFRKEFSTRLSFCCNRCRRRITPMSVRFLGRRVWLGWAVVLGSTRPLERNPAAAALCAALSVPLRTLERWRRWWREAFLQTPLWQMQGAQFLPPVTAEQMPGGMLERMVGTGHTALQNLLRWTPHPGTT